jgi:murein DD-endopeptidase MepM/ murein hydrolase activator NlpD
MRRIARLVPIALLLLAMGTLASASSGSGSHSARARAGYDGFDFPLPTWKQSGFGFGDDWKPLARCPANGPWEKHTGIDVKASKGQAVRASANGTYINIVYWGAGWANAVLISHNVPGFGTVISQYGHVDGIGLKPGSAVTRGQVIAHVANLGSNTHLHFGIWLGAYASAAWRGHLPTTRCGGRPAFPASFTNPTAFVNAHRPGSDFQIPGLIGFSGTFTMRNSIFGTYACPTANGRSISDLNNEPNDLNQFDFASQPVNGWSAIWTPGQLVGVGSYITSAFLVWFGSEFDGLTFTVKLRSPTGEIAHLYAGNGSLCDVSRPESTPSGSAYPIGFGLTWENPNTPAKLGTQGQGCGYATWDGGPPWHINFRFTDARAVPVLQRPHLTCVGGRLTAAP